MASNSRQEGISEEKRADLKAKRLGIMNDNSASSASTPAASASVAAVAPQKSKRYRVKKTKRVRKYIQEWITIWRKEEWAGEYERRKLLKKSRDVEEGFRWFEITGDDGWKEADGYSDDERLVEDEILVDVGSYEVDEEDEEFEDKNGSWKLKIFCCQD
ncbi:hypothetical protein ACEPPN_014542 [Leptodophora sp. 'Broadleaf-Isolate-01']